MPTKELDRSKTGRSTSAVGPEARYKGMVFGYYTPEIFASFVLVLVVSLIVFEFKRTNYKLRTWAAEHGYTITDISSKGRGKNPYFFNMKRASVYYVKLKDQKGQSRACWLRVPQYGYGIDCTWEDQ